MIFPLILCDIDGTLALRGDRSAHDHDQAMEDAVNEPVADLIKIIDSFYTIVLVSGREEKYRDITTYWMWKHNLQSYWPLIMRPTGDNRPDDVVKKELYEQVIVPKYGKPVFVLDDRDKVVKMWRSLGLTCLQVADGNF